MLTSRVLRFWTLWQDRVAINPGFLLPLVGLMEIGVSPLQRGKIHLYNLNKTNSYDGIQYGDNSHNQHTMARQVKWQLTLKRKMSFWNCLCFNKIMLIGKLRDVEDQIRPVLLTIRGSYFCPKKQVYFILELLKFNHMVNTLVFIICTSSSLCISIWHTWTSQDGKMHWLKSVSLHSIHNS